uniref:Uncharacterized protein n=1 Tax=Chrysemys picta bellii TaxID=8478 RepID=A0A8C3FHY5_CHRPI
MSGQSEPSISQSIQPGPDEGTKEQRDIRSFAQHEWPSQHASKTATPASSAREFPTKLHADGDKLFCTLCNVVLNHERWSVIVDSFTITNVSLMVNIYLYRVKTLAGANIPSSKTDHPLVREFLDSRVQNGGAILGRPQLAEMYLSEVYLKGKENFKLKLKEKKIAVLFDNVVMMRQDQF